MQRAVLACALGAVSVTSAMAQTPPSAPPAPARPVAGAARPNPLGRQGVQPGNPRAGDRRGGGPRGVGPRDGGPRAGGRGPGGRAPGGPAGMLLRQRDRLGLTADQVKKLEALQAAPQPQVNAADLLRARADLMDATRGDANPEKARTAMDRMAKLRTDVAVARLKARQEARNVLTPAQKAQVDAMAQRMKGRMRGAMMQRMRGGQRGGQRGGLMGPGGPQGGPQGQGQGPAMMRGPRGGGMGRMRGMMGPGGPPAAQRPPMPPVPPEAGATSTPPSPR
ncbi:MAG: Spy/CpxP family protein refolding chaperone [Gemmatimonadaceae bacterium]